MTNSITGINNTKYNYDDQGLRISRINENNKELVIRDHSGKELGVMDLTTQQYKYFNLFGLGLIGRVDPNYTEQITYDEEGEPIVYFSRQDDKVYYAKDHLGNIRRTFNQLNQVISTQDYGPFGRTIRSEINAADVNPRYKFTEKERDKETNLDYFGARYYDSELIVWGAVDPLADKYPGWSPYNYCVNNPFKIIDPNGMEIDYNEYESSGLEGEGMRVNSRHSYTKDLDQGIYNGQAVALQHHRVIDNYYSSRMEFFNLLWKHFSFLDADPQDPLLATLIRSANSVSFIKGYINMKSNGSNWLVEIYAAAKSPLESEYSITYSGKASLLRDNKVNQTENLILNSSLEVPNWTPIGETYFQLPKSGKIDIQLNLFNSINTSIGIRNSSFQHIFKIYP